MVHPEKSDWLKSQQKSQKKYRIIIATFGIIVLLSVIGGAAYALIFKSKNSYNNDNINESINPNDPGKSNDGKSNDGKSKKLGDPTANGQMYFTWDKKPVNLTITPNPAYKKIFYGVNYGPVNATFPWCTNTLGDVIEDIKLISQLTNRIRL